MAIATKALIVLNGMFTNALTSATPELAPPEDANCFTDTRPVLCVAIRFAATN